MLMTLLLILIIGASLCAIVLAVFEIMVAGILGGKAASLGADRPTPRKLPQASPANRSIIPTAH